MIPRIARLQRVVLLCSLCVGSCAPANGPYTGLIAPGLYPRLTVQDAIAISRGYLADQTPELAAPELHIFPRITSVWAVRADEASDLDGCIPVVPGNQIVWVTKGQGDYLNLSDHPWSKRFSRASQLDPNPSRMVCEAPGPQGTLVIDDATGAILGVYPESPGYWHPSAMPK
jgi:hypothetical protein